jgi:chromosomal replication initiator protein
LSDASYVVDSILGIPLPGQPLPGHQSPDTDRNQRLVLDRFILGPENQLAEAAIRSLLCDSADPYNPLVFYGPPGTGKSHLARGLADAWKVDLRRGVLYVLASDFARDLTDALETNALQEFRARFRSPALLVVEDIDLLSERPGAQQELLNTLDAQAEAGNRVIVTANCAPSLLPGFLPGLRSRLTAGLTVPLAPPQYATRAKVLRELAALRGIPLSEAVVDILAQNMRATVPELFGALVQLEMAAQAEGSPIGVPLARQYVKARQKAQSPQLREIARLTARHFSLKLRDLKSTSRRQAVVRARGVAMYLARLLTQNSLEDIGRYFGGRDHTTVLYGCRKTEELLPHEPSIHEAVVQLQQQFH